MKANLAALCLAALGGASALLLPATSQAANVGHYTSCPGNVGDIAATITAAGHTPVAVATLDAASLVPLDGLVVADGCGRIFSAPNQAINDAVANGLLLFLEVQHVTAGLGTSLPGTPTLQVTSYDTNSVCLLDTNLAAGSPIASGPGGVLTNTSLDSTFNCSPMGYATSASLPGGAIGLLTTQDPSQIAAFAYAHGSGRVVLSISQWMYFLPSQTHELTAGSQTYYTNVVAWMMGNLPPATTCASEGYTGTKLTWCRNICESELPQATLDIWIHRWINRYRDLPYCAVEEEEEPPQEG